MKGGIDDDEILIVGLQIIEELIIRMIEDVVDPELEVQLVKNDEIELLL